MAWCGLMRNIKQLYKQIKPTLIHTVEYQEYTSQDRNHTASFKPSVTISNCRVDMTRTYTQTASTESESISAVLFMVNGLSTPFTALKEKSKVIYNGKTYRIYKILDNYEPFANNLFSYEVELINEA